MSLLFWKSWSRAERVLYLAGLLLFFISILLFVGAWWRGLGNVVRWDVLSELLDVPTTFRTFTDGLLDYPLRGKAYAVAEQFVASAMQVHPWMATLLLAGVGVATTLLLSAITALPRTPYLGAMALFVLALAVFRFETLELPGLNGRSVFGVLAVLFGGLSYYFHAFRPDVPIPLRIGAFGALITAVALALGALAAVPHPALTAVSYGLPALLVISVGFILFIAFEIIAALIWLTSVRRSANTRPLGPRNFAFIAGLYLVNLLLIWLKNNRSVDWELLAISPFVLYLISATLGIWGFRRLLDQQTRVSFRSAGAYLYVGLALLSTLTVAYAFGTANDPLVEVFEDAIVYGHLAMGVAFVVYFLLNFLPPFRAGTPVYRVLYRPQVAPLMLFRLAGLAGVVGLAGATNYLPLRQAVAGYYNGLGDLYVASGEPTSAGAFYQLALEQENRNHKANYALASLALAQNDRTTAAFFFQQSLLKQPSVQAFVNLSRAFEQNNLFFEAVKTLQRGIRTFPDAGELRNNLGYLYARTSVADSAYFYLQSAVGQTSQVNVPATNLLSLFIRNPQVLAADSSLAQTDAAVTDASYQANALALRLVRQQPDTTQPQRPAWLSDSQRSSDGLSAGRFASLYNYALLNTRPDTALTAGLARRAQHPDNQSLTDDLLLAHALSAYVSHQPTTTFATLAQLAEGDPSNGATYRTLNGLLMLEQGLHQGAAQALDLNTDTLSTFYRAIAYTKAGELALAQPLWDVAATGDRSVNALKQVLYDERPPADDLEKAFYVSYRPDNPNRGRYWETIRDPNLKTVAGARLIETYLETGQPFYAQMILSQLGKPTQLNAFALSVENLSALRIAVFRNKPAAADSLSRAAFLPQHQAERQFLIGQVLERSGQSAPARQAYQAAAQLAPLTPRYVVAAARLLRSGGQVPAAYALVLNALNVNETNPELLKAYVTLCLDQSLIDYAQAGLARLQTTTSVADYQAFAATYQQKVAQLEKSRQKFLQ